MSRPSRHIQQGILARAMDPPHEAIRAARSKVSMTVARLIAADVADRKLAPGSPLPPEQEMAAFFGVGRPSIREALRILEAQGLVSIKPGQGGGPVVRRPTPADHGQSISLFLQTGGVTYRDALEMHTLLAGLIAEQAAERAAEHDGDLVEALVAASRNELDDGRDDATFVSSGSDFHDVMARLAGNETLTMLAGALGYVFAVRAAHLNEGRWAVEERRQIAAEHRALASAIRAGSPRRARRLGEEHVARQVERLVEASPEVLDEVVDWR